MLILDENNISPIPSNAEPLECLECKGSKARWIVNQDSLCAHCFLSVSAWAVDNKSKILDFTKNVEKVTGLTMLSEHEVLDQHSDRILSAIVFMTKYKRTNRAKK